MGVRIWIRLASALIPLFYITKFANMESRTKDEYLNPFIPGETSMLPRDNYKGVK